MYTCKSYSISTAKMLAAPKKIKQNSTNAINQMATAAKPQKQTKPCCVT